MGNKVNNPSVAIITFHWWINGNLNYGATLQAVALAAVIEQMGRSVELINYIPEIIPTEGKLKTLYRHWFRKRITNKVPAEKRQGFETFLQQYGRMGKREYTSLNELRAHPPKADIYISGSDQIWNTDIFHDCLFPAFFLDFGSPKKRVAYASSFGSGEVSVKHTAQISRMLSKYSAIAVREKSGAEIAERLVKNTVPVRTVLDPTLLLENYNELLTPMETKGRLLAYLFYPGEEEINLLKTVADEIGMLPAIIGDAGQPDYDGIEKIICNSPAEWMGAIKSAGAVVTNSFHGTAFSIMFKRPFVSLLSADSGQTNRNTRVQNLAAKLDLEDQLTEKRDAKLWQQKLETSIYWQSVHGRLGVARADSMAYLADALTLEEK